MWKILSREVAFQNKWWKIMHEKVELPDGQTVDYYPLDGAGITVVIGITDDGKVPILKIYKHGAREVILDVPGGMIDEGEDVEAGARREYLEETGYEIGTLEPLPPFYISPTSGASKAYPFIARGLKKVKEPDDNIMEKAEVLLVPVEEVGELIRTAQIASASDLAAIQLAFERTGLLRFARKDEL